MFQVKMLYTEKVGNKTTMTSAIFFSMKQAMAHSKKRGVHMIRIMRLSDHVVIAQSYGLA